MIPVTELEMATNTTFASILNEIQLSNLNFNIKITPFAAYITLKKTLQRDLNGNFATPAPPLLFLLQQTQEQNLNLRVENSEMKSVVDTLEKKIDTVEQEKKGLIKILEETRKTVDDLTDTNNNFHKRVNEAEKVSARNKAESSENERKLKENKKKHVLEQKKLHDQIKDLKHEKKTSEKQNYDLNKTLENARETLKTYKADRSQLKICNTKLEVKVRKLEEQIRKEKKKIVKTIRKENKDENAGIKTLDQVLSSDSSDSTSSFLTMSAPSFTSMIAHWKPSPTPPPLMPSSITTMVTHCPRLPSPTFSLCSAEEYKAMIEKIIERAFANLRWSPLDAETS